jgi:hypothetical protein
MACSSSVRRTSDHAGALPRTGFPPVDWNRMMLASTGRCQKRLDHADKATGVFGV